MFFALRKLVLVALAGLLGTVGFFLYQKKSALTVFADFFEALKMTKDSPRREFDSVAGEVIKITGQYSFQMRTEPGLLFNFQLTGLEPIEARDASDEEKQRLEEESRILLSRLILSNHIRVDPTYIGEKRTGLGLVYVGETNINSALVEAGLARLKRKYLKGLSVGELYQMFRAERKAKDSKFGIWKE